MNVRQRGAVDVTASRTAGMRGFTLIEVMLAVAITSIVMLLVGTTFRVTLDARYTIEELAESTDAGPRILALLERDLRGLWTYDIKNNRVLVGRNSDVGSFEADRIDMLTTTDSIGYVLDAHNQPRQTSICEVGYWLKPNQRYRDLIELWRREDPLVDNDLLTDGRFQLVHDRIKSFKITYYKSLGYEAEELHEWDSSAEDELPRRLKIEFTLERKRGSRNVVDDAEFEDLEGAQKTYVRHLVLDRRLMDALKAGVAVIPLRPPKPEVQSQGPAGPAGPAGSGNLGGLGPRGGQIQLPKGGEPPPPGGRGPRGAGGPPPGMPPGFNIGDLLRGGGNGGGLGGLFGNGGRGGR